MMIPLPFILTAISLWIAWRIWSDDTAESGQYYPLAFLLVTAFQTMLVGLRFGYGFEQLYLLQPLTAVMVAPLGYLAFLRPTLRHGLLIGLLPFVGALIAVAAGAAYIDGYLALNNFLFVVLLVRLGLSGSDAMGWIDTNKTRVTMYALWLVAGFILFSSGTDALIALDFLRTGGQHTRSIVVAAIVLCLIIIVSIPFALRHFTSKRGTSLEKTDGTVLEAQFQTVDTALKDKRLFTDPDLTLNRIGRRLHMPVRDVSRSINYATGDNVSKYINSLRVEEACRLIGEEKASVTEAIYASGFNTKSNFNREFLRVTGQTPSAWRTEHRA